MKTTRFLLTSLLLISFFGARSAFAKSKIDVMGGYFSLEAKTKEKSGNVNNFGSYQIGLRYAVNSFLEASVGYSLVASKTFSGDFGFGPDIGLVYFPFTSANPIEASSENVHYRSYELYKPYLSVAFHQRQYQSIQSSYAGFGFGGGTEIYWKENMSLNLGVRFLPLAGPDSAISNEFDVLMGITFSL